MARQLKTETRTTPLDVSDLAAENNGNTLVGYPIVFNQWTEINDATGRYRELISPTALKKTLEDNRDRIRVQFDHGMHPWIGSLPLGKPTIMRTDKRGLYVEVPLSDTSYNQDLKALLRDGAIDGMSFRFQIVNEKWARPKGALPERTITEIKLFEFGPVVYPAYSTTSAGVRTGRKPVLTEKQAADIATLRKFAQGPKPKKTLARRLGLTRAKSDHQLNNEAITRLRAATASARLREAQRPNRTRPTIPSYPYSVPSKPSPAQLPNWWWATGHHR